MGEGVRTVQYRFRTVAGALCLVDVLEERAHGFVPPVLRVRRVKGTARVKVRVKLEHLDAVERIAQSARWLEAGAGGRKAVKGGA